MTAGYLGGYLGYDSTGGGPVDHTPPVVTIISPLASTDPGDVGGFVTDWETARNTPVVIRIVDAAPGNLYQCVVARLVGILDELVVYRRGEFRGRFVGRSTQTPTDDGGIELSILPLEGWPSSDVLNDLELEVDAVDAAGNLCA